MSDDSSDHDDPRDLALDRHVEWCKDNPLEREMQRELDYWLAKDPDHVRKAVERLCGGR